MIINIQYVAVADSQPGGAWFESRPGRKISDRNASIRLCECAKTWLFNVQFVVDNQLGGAGFKFRPGRKFSDRNFPFLEGSFSERLAFYPVFLLTTISGRP
jgi:hypothetical protein